MLTDSSELFESHYLTSENKSILSIFLVFIFYAFLQKAYFWKV